ncbi:hypothetical protein HT136_11030 [Novosphingobium profundi]|uniref:hypothetical protein n=1 Tax=Novosphingobium profundi TaxID=1774954 RepID=UPI001BDA0999|nr:hypothetical protein [Novosphingobium profundi]MBT0668900.1 hypothetical protein [Novosphingobium profundi]
MKPQTAGRRAMPGLDDSEDQTFGMIAALASELAMARERIDTLERLLAAQGTLDADAVEAYVPDEEAAKARGALRQRMIGKVFRPIREAAIRRAAQSTPTKGA